jgi:uncharacterized protein (TIGR03083 family)
VPACPAWTVHDLIAHHTGTVVGLADGSLAELGDLARLLDQSTDAAVARDRDAMTAHQVAERRDHSITTILHEWSDATERILPMLRAEAPFPDGVGAMGGVIAINDIVVHEGDLYEALGRDRAAVVHATSLALAGYGFGLDRRIRDRGMPALAFSYDGKQRVFGAGEPAATLTADRTTLVRLLASRLVAAEIVRLDWVGDPAPYLDIIPEYGPARP